MTKATFLLSKDPILEHGGDVELSRLVIALAAESFSVAAICFSSETDSVVTDLTPVEVPLTRVHKPAIRKTSLAAASLSTGRSLVHVRFDTDELVAAIDACDSDVFVAEHSYMAESFLRSARFRVSRLVVNTHVSESLVWRATRGVLGRLQVGRLLRDELRVAAAADALGTYDADEADYYRAHGARAVRWMDLTLPPAAQVRISATPRRLVLMGTRDWPPNQEAFLHALRLWPRIAEGIPDAELCIVGGKKFGARDPAYPNGVRDLGFVADLSGFLASCRAVIAPIKTGGGVRVKILDAARMGLPVVGTTAAVGSLGPLLELPVFDDEDAFIDRCRRYLLDRDVAAAAGDLLYQVNRRCWDERRPHRAVEALLCAQVP
jgi:glycosyltransferase involved in cell wall biosynthesis